MNKIIHFEILHLDPLGQGVHKDQNDIFFIPKTLPGEQGEATISSHKKKVHFAYPQKWEVCSPLRVKPNCPHFNDCTSCHYLHTDYESELEFKKKSLLKVFQGISFEWDKLMIHPAKNRFHYRNRIQLHYDLKKNIFGYISRKTNQIIPIENCQLPHLEISLRLQSLYADGWKEICPSSSPINGHFELSLKENDVKIIFNRPYSDDGFIQVNQSENQTLKKLILDYFNQYLSSDNVMLDLFGGDGNLSEHLNSFQTFIFDLFKKLPPKTPNRYYHHLDIYTETAIIKIKEMVGQCRLILLDPPRSGYDRLYKLVEVLGPEYIFYVSCNAQTLARDLKSLTNYQLIHIHLIDFFPCTYHYETFCVLKKLDSRLMSLLKLPYKSNSLLSSE